MKQTIEVTVDVQPTMETLPELLLAAAEYLERYRPGADQPDLTLVQSLQDQLQDVRAERDRALAEVERLEARVLDLESPRPSTKGHWPQPGEPVRLMPSDGHGWTTATLKGWKGRGASIALVQPSGHGHVIEVARSQVRTTSRGVALSD